jgi:hypothetical protein
VCGVACLTCAGCGGAVQTEEHRDLDHSDASGSGGSQEIEADIILPVEAEVDAVAVADAGLEVDAAAEPDAVHDAAFDGRPYIPTGPVPAYDAGTLLGGSLDSPEHGWDYCPTRTSGVFISTKELPPSVGTRFGRFTSGPCMDSCSPDNPVEAQLFLWGLPPNPRPALYVDMINEATIAPEGRLRFYGVDEVCGSEEMLADVDLEALLLEHEWSTRCIPLKSTDRVGFGIAVQGGSFDIGLDALRFGPPCE